MDFQASDMQQMLSHSLERLLTDRYAVPSRIASGGLQSGEPVWPALSEMGLFGVEVAEEYGGVGGTFEDLSCVFQPLGAFLIVEPLVASTVVGTGLISQLATIEQKERLLPSLASGEAKVALGHTERRARDLLSWVETTAKRTDTGWEISGSKHVVSGADSADFLIVSARTSGEPRDEQGISLFLIDATDPHVTRRGYDLYDHSRAADLEFSGLRIPADALLGELGCGFPAVARAWDRAAAVTCAEAIGAMEALRDLTLDYLRTRQQFGQPIGKFQVLQHRMADAHMAIELARSMSLLAISALEEQNETARMSQVSAAKVVIGKACREVAQTCVQLHGGIALTEEYPAGHYFKRLTMIERLFGDVEHHLDRYVRLTN